MSVTRHSTFVVVPFSIVPGLNEMLSTVAQPQTSSVLFSVTLRLPEVSFAHTLHVRLFGISIVVGIRIVKFAQSGFSDIWVGDVSVLFFHPVPLCHSRNPYESMKLSVQFE